MAVADRLVHQRQPIPYRPGGGAPQQLERVGRDRCALGLRHLVEMGDQLADRNAAQIEALAA